MHPDLSADLFSGALAQHADAAETQLRGRLAGAPGAAPLEAALYLDARLGLVDDMLTYFDRASMACSLEVRVPFLDHELVELCARIPAEHKVRRLQGKHVLRLASREHVPDFVLEKRKRGFFNEAVGSWVGAGDGALVDELLLGSRSRLRARARPRGGGARRRPSGAPAGGHANLLLALMMLEVWLGEYLPRALSRRPGDGGRMSALRYAVVTPARNEERNLQRLARALAAQTLRPARVGRGGRRLDGRHAARARRPRRPPPVGAAAAAQRRATGSSPPGAATRAT